MRSQTLQVRDLWFLAMVLEHLGQINLFVLGPGFSEISPLIIKRDIWNVEAELGYRFTLELK